MNLNYFQPKMGSDIINKPKDKGLLSKDDLLENAKNKAYNIERSKNKTGLMEKDESKLLTNDGREILI